MWDEVTSRYGVSNGPMLYQLEREITFLSHVSMSIMVYYSKLKRLCDELNELEPHSKKVKIATSLSLLDHAEGSSAMFGRTFADDKKVVKKWDDKKAFLKCDHYNMRGHTKDNCYRLKGFPDNFGSRNQKSRFQNVRSNNAMQREMVKFRESNHHSNAELSIMHNVNSLQDQQSRNIVGIAAQTRGLYVLDDESFHSSTIQKFVSNYVQFNKLSCGNFWAETVLTATYIINRLPSSVLDGKIPHEKLFNKVPDIKHMTVFGCLCFVTHTGPNTDKFYPRVYKGVFIGYAAAQKGYKVL
ncbi:hypothetical protein LIER_14344 [Lithospermum erythrorhizon]|uniref:Retroviral polymerase SH3-like domain-containing protein n=1 Tax=Lithospermum erythrorhizon TaxID=34254 RepID=A0AAV3Q0E6_LITER